MRPKIKNGRFKLATQRNTSTAFLVFSCLTAFSAGLQNCNAEQPTGYYTDPATGIVYRQVVRTVERPVVETRMTERQETIYKPKTVTETRPTTRHTYTPVTEFYWVPRVEGRWNPFRQPRVAYHHVPETRWQARQEVVAETQTHVQWEPETQTVQVPQQSLSIAREQKVEFEAVGRVALPSAFNVSPQIAARLQPLASSQWGSPLNAGSSTGVAAVNAPGYSLAELERPRSNLQQGMRATELTPRTAPTYGPIGGGMNASGIAGLPVMRMWR